MPQHRAARPRPAQALRLRGSRAAALLGALLATGSIIPPAACAAGAAATGLATDTPAGAARADETALRRAVTRLVTQDLVAPAALAALADALEAGHSDPTHRSFAAAARARASFRDMQVAAWEGAVTTAGVQAAASGDALARFHALRQSGMLQMNRGDYEQAVRDAVEALAAARDSGEPVALVAALANLGTVAQFAGEFEDSVRYYAEALALARQLAEPGIEAVIHNNLGYLSIENGDLDAALRSFDQAAALAEESGNGQIVFTQASGRALVQLARGDAAGAIARLLGTLDEAGTRIDSYLRGELRVFLARAQYAAGDATAASRNARLALQLLAGMPARALAAHVVLADAQIADGNAGEAATRARDAAHRAAAGTRLRATLLDTEARALAAAGRHAEAYTVQLEALQERDRSSADRARARLGFVQARFADQLAQRELALAREQRATFAARSAESREQRNFALTLLALVLVATTLGGLMLQRRRLAEREAARLHQLDALGQLTGGVAHDFNNLMTVVEQSAGLLRERSGVRDDELALRLIEESRGAARAGAQITRQLLSFARRQPLAPETLLLDVYLLGIRALLAGTLGGRLRFGIEVQQPSPAVRADRALLGAALVNLLANARDATAPGGTVRIQVTRAIQPAGTVAIAVIDDGSGMSAEVLRRATEPFFTTRELQGGGGLGLSMVDGFWRQSGGELRLDSRPGHGTTATMVLPEDVLATMIETVRAPNQQGRFFGQSALLVEDNDRLRRVLELSLAEIGFVVRSAPSGDVAREMLGQGDPPDLLFSDIRMPGQLNGVQLATWAADHCPGMRVLLQTGYAEEDAGRFAVLRKPFTAEELIGAIAAVFATPARPAP
jgi:signal transduction histidine kinase